MNNMKNDSSLKKIAEHREIDGIITLIRDIEQMKRSLNILEEYLQNVKCIGSVCLDRKTVYALLENILGKIQNDRDIAEMLFAPVMVVESPVRDSIHFPESSPFAAAS